MALTPDSLEHYRRILTALRGEIATQTSRAESEVGEQSDLEHSDPVDRATAANAKDDLLHEVGRESEQLVAIDESLRRIQAGTYGTCAVCGKELTKARLDAVPWATLCLADQEIADRRQGAAMAYGGAPSRVA